MIFTIPIVAVIMGVMPFAPEITKSLSSTGWGAAFFNLFPVMPLVVVFAVFIALHRFLDMFFGTTYYYLIADVVPVDHIGRLWSLFRITGTIHGILFSWFCFPLLLSHTKELVVTAAVFYGVAVMLMCWRVKEGEYPPVELKQEDQKRWYDGIQRYVKECFGHSYYWLIFIYYGCTQWGGVIGSLGIFFSRDELGLSLSTLGKFGAVMGIVTLPYSLFINYVAGGLVDRWGALRTRIYAFYMGLPLSIAGFFLVMGLREMAIFGIIGALPGALNLISITKLLIEVYPRERYGQFCSAGAIVASVGAIVFGPLLGIFFDWLQWYRCLGLWGLFLGVVGFPLLLIIYKRWKAYGGGTDQYSPP